MATKNTVRKTAKKGNETGARVASTRLAAISNPTKVLVRCVANLPLYNPELSNVPSLSSWGIRYDE